MTREFLKNLGIDDANIDKILDENSRDIGKEKQKAEQHKADLDTTRKQLEDREKDLEELKKTAGDAEAIKKQLEELQVKYTKETEAHKAEIAERDYDAAIARHMESVDIKSTLARSAFVAGLKAKKLEIKDGKLDGFDKYLEEAKKVDPEAFAPDKPAPQFGRPTGGSNVAPANTPSRAAQIAAQMNASLYGTVKKE